MVTSSIIVLLTAMFIGIAIGFVLHMVITTGRPDGTIIVMRDSVDGQVYLSAEFNTDISKLQNKDFVIMDIKNLDP